MSSDVGKCLAERPGRNGGQAARVGRFSEAPGIETLQAVSKLLGLEHGRYGDFMIMPVRKGYIIEQIADLDNLRAADKEAQAGKTKKNRYIRRHNLHAEEHLQELRRMILDLDFPDPEYSEMEVRNDCGKVRKINRQRYFPWRILHHAIIRVVGDELFRSLIADTFACVPGRGLHYGVKRLRMFLRRYPQYRWYFKADYKKFYPSIPHDAAMAQFRRKYKDKRFLRLLEVAIFNYDSGQELNEILHEEQRKKERIAHRRVPKPADRQPGGQPG